MAVVADYTMSEKPGSAVVSDTGPGSAQDGSFLGKMSTDGKGNAEFDGVDDYIEIPASKDFALTEGTIQIKATMASASPADWPYQTPAAHTLFSVDASSYGNGGHLTIYVKMNGEVGVRHQSDSSSTEYKGGSVKIGESFSINYSFGPNGSILMVDGVKVASGSTALVLGGADEPVLIGAAQSQSTPGTADDVKGNWHGTIDRVVIDDSSNASPVCFCANTLITTPRGSLKAGSLARGDLVMTRDHGPLPILFACRTVIPSAVMAAQPRRRPVVISAGMLGNHTALTVTRQHCLLLGMDGDEVLVRAVHLARFGSATFLRPGASGDLTVVHLLLDRHAVVLANGAWAETLLPGAPVVRKVTPNAPHPPMPAPPCRPILDAQAAAQLLSSGHWTIPDTAQPCQQTAAHP